MRIFKGVMSNSIKQDIMCRFLKAIFKFANRLSSLQKHFLQLKFSRFFYQHESKKFSYHSLNKLLLNAYYVPGT